MGDGREEWREEKKISSRIQTPPADTALSGAKHGVDLTHKIL